MVEQVSIYSLHDPESDELRYIGKTIHPIDKRRRLHISNARRAAKSNYTANWIKSLLRKGLEPKVRLVDIVSEANWVQAERDYIRLARTVGCRLTNLTDGGEGTHGHRPSKEAIEKSQRGRQGFKHTDESRALLSAVVRKRYAEGWRASSAFDPEVQQKISAALTGKEHSLEHRRSLSLSGRPEPLQKEWRDDKDRPVEWRKKIGQANSGERNARAKLTVLDVRYIKVLLRDTNWLHKEIAELHNVSPQCITNISQGRNWVSVKCPEGLELWL